MFTMIVGTQKIKLIDWAATNSISFAGKMPASLGNNDNRGALGREAQIEFRKSINVRSKGERG